MTVRTHKFTPGIYDILLDCEYDGVCTRPDLPGEKDERTIWIHPKTRGQARLETIVHESLHAEFPRMTEKEVHAAGHNIARLLWRLGYRTK